MSDILWIVSGALLLIAGRKLYWLFVALVGFFAGMTLATMFVKTQAEWVQWVIALAFGGLGVLLAVGLQKVAVGAAGFIAGGYGLVYFLDIIGINFGDSSWLFFIGGGIVGMVLVLAMFEFALILLSSVVGATLVSQSFTLAAMAETIVFLVLVLVGISIQLAAQRVEGKSAKAHSSE